MILPTPCDLFTREYRSKRVALGITNIHEPIAVLVLHIQLAHAGLPLVQQLLPNKQVDAILALVQVELRVQHGFEVIKGLLFVDCELAVAECWQLGVTQWLDYEADALLQIACYESVEFLGAVLEVVTDLEGDVLLQRHLYTSIIIIQQVKQARLGQ